jgi:hypothetical protein
MIEFSKSYAWINILISGGFSVLLVRYVLWEKLLEYKFMRW